VSKIDIYYLRIEGDNFLFPSPVQLKKRQIIGGHKEGDKRDYSMLHNNNDADAIIPS
jgi:hypothetical protein